VPLDFRWRQTGSGQRVAHVQVPFSLSREDCVNLLAASGLDVTGATLAKEMVEARIRAQLSVRAEERHFWHEKLPEAEARERRTWAEALIDRCWPEASG